MSAPMRPVLLLTHCLVYRLSFVSSNPWGLYLEDMMKKKDDNGNFGLSSTTNKPDDVTTKIPSFDSFIEEGFDSYEGKYNSKEVMNIQDKALDNFKETRAAFDNLFKTYAMWANALKDKMMKNVPKMIELEENNKLILATIKKVKEKLEKGSPREPKSSEEKADGGKSGGKGGGKNSGSKESAEGGKDGSKGGRAGGGKRDGGVDGSPSGAGGPVGGKKDGGEGNPVGGSPGAGSASGGTSGGGSLGGGSSGRGSPNGGSPVGAIPGGSGAAGGSPSGGSPDGGSPVGGSPGGGSPGSGSPGAGSSGGSSGISPGGANKDA